MNRLPARLVPILALLAGCTPEHETHEIGAPRAVATEPMPLGASPTDRFGSRMPGSPAGQPSGPSAAAASGAPYTFALPAGWTEAPPAMFRDVNLVVPGGVECWVTKMAAGAGGPVANHDRWRTQLGLEAVGEAGLAQLPRETLLGQEALFVDLTSADSSTRLVGFMLFAPDQSVFLRISGPVEAVQEAMQSFNDLAASLREAAGTEPGTGASGPPETAPPEDGTEAGDAGSTGDTVSGGGPASAGGFTWTAPAGWQPLTTDAFRLAYYQVTADTQSWISVLTGTGGGVEANVVRWYGQAGRPRPGSAAVAELPRLNVLGQEALWVDLLNDGDAVGLIGVICMLPTQSLFVKIQGPSDMVRAHVEEFRTFCTSLEFE